MALTTAVATTTTRTAATTTRTAATLPPVLKTAFADASHMDGKGSITYGTFYDVGTYDPNRALLSIACGHSIGPECNEEWATRFNAAANVPGFDVPARVTLVDMEKSIDTAFDAAMVHAKKFNDERHVIKNMNNKLGPSEKATGPALYSRALRAPSVLEVEQLKVSYGPAQKAYLGKFPDSELYRACSPGLVDTIVTSQGAESSMNAALANKIRRVEPMAMLKLITSSASLTPKRYSALRGWHRFRALGVTFSCFVQQAPVTAVLLIGPGQSMDRAGSTSCRADTCAVD